MVGRLTVNPYTGDTPVDVGGQRLTLAFDWRALAQVRSEIGIEGQAQALAGNLEFLPRLISIGLMRHHPNWTAEMVAEASPPLMPTIKAAENALSAAWFGPDGAPDESSDENPPQPPQTLFGRVWRRLIGQV